MKNKIKQVVGIDIAKKKFDVCFLQEENGKQIVKVAKSFSNDLEGFKLYLEGIQKRKKENSLLHIMEATGVYHEDLCGSKNQVFF